MLTSDKCTYEIRKAQNSDPQTHAGAFICKSQVAQNMYLIKGL